MSFESAFTNPKVLETARLRLRVIKISDLEAMFEIKSDEEVTSRYCRLPHRSKSETEKWLTDLIKSHDERSVIPGA